MQAAAVFWFHKAPGAQAQISCHPYQSVQIEKGLHRSLPKKGILRKLVGDFLGFLAEVAEIRDLETQRRLQESPYFVGFSRFVCELS
jgi:hypothetical protein